jgi:hypothetical protein
MVNDTQHMNSEIIGERIQLDEPISQEAQEIFDGVTVPKKPKRSISKIILIGVVVLVAGFVVVSAFKNKLSEGNTPSSTVQTAPASVLTPSIAQLPQAPSLPSAQPASYVANGVTVEQLAPAAPVTNSPVQQVAQPAQLVNAPAPAPAPSTAPQNTDHAVHSGKTSDQKQADMIAQLAKLESDNKKLAEEVRKLEHHSHKEKNKISTELSTELSPLKPVDKTPQSVTMSKYGISAIMTDGVILHRDGNDVEVSVGESIPGLGELRKANAKDKVIETTSGIYKFN